MLVSAASTRVPIASKSFLLTALKELARPSSSTWCWCATARSAVLRYQLPKE
ncbi:MAG: hypothetical protein U1E76_05960 [Planctomycetota bacterium]